MPACRFFLRIFQIFSNTIFSPLETFLKSSAASEEEMRPRKVTGEIARGFSFVEAGVLPKKTQKAFPDGQYAKSPISISCFDGFSSSAMTGISK